MLKFFFAFAESDCLKFYFFDLWAFENIKASALKALNKSTYGS